MAVTKKQTKTALKNSHLKQRKIMKKALTFVLLMAGFQSFATIKSDTTVIEFVDKGMKKRLSVQSESKSFTFKIPSNLNLESLLKEIGVDSTERKKTILMVENGGKKDTIIAISRDGHNIKIIARDPRTDRKDSLNHEPRRQYDDSKNDDNLEITKKENGTSMNDTYDREYDEPKETDEEKRQKRLSSKYFSKKDFGLYLGLNSWTAESGAVPSLNTWGSKFVALSWRRNRTLLKSNAVDVALSYAPEFAWYNFRLAENRYAVYNGGQVELVKATENLRKSKIVMPSFNIPIMLNLGLKESKINIGFGGYFGWKVGGYTRIDTNEDKRNKEKGNYGINSFRKGLTAEIGKKGGVAFFVRKDIDNLFRNDQTKINNNLTAWSAGIRL
jgi:hypothetical protein